MIIIRYDPFSMTSIAYVCKEGHTEIRGISSNMASIAGDIAAIANESQIYSIKIDASRSIVEEIKEQLTTVNYGKEKFEVEGI